MLNLDERLNDIGRSLVRALTSNVPESDPDEKVKQLITDVLDYVQPKKLTNTSGGQRANDVRAGYADAIDYMVDSRKRLGL